MKLLAIQGALRVESTNRKLLKVAISHLPKGVTTEIYELHDIPFYDGDVEAKGLPEVVVEFRKKIENADGILIATPEYNYGVPGVLKNAIDWASRPPKQPFDKKPVVILGASSGMFGTARAQIQMRLLMQYLNAYAMPRPEFLLGMSAEKFDSEGNLKDEKSRELLEKFMKAAVEWWERFKS